jgi:hypothetical protein
VFFNCHAVLYWFIKLITLHLLRNIDRFPVSPFVTTHTLLRWPLRPSNSRSVRCTPSFTETHYLHLGKHWPSTKFSVICDCNKEIHISQTFIRILLKFRFARTRTNMVRLLHTYIHTHTHINTYIHAYIHTHTHIHTYIRTYIHIYTHTYTHIHTYIRTYIRARTNAHVSWIYHGGDAEDSVFRDVTPYRMVKSYVSKDQASSRSPLFNSEDEGTTILPHSGDFLPVGRP